MGPVQDASFEPKHLSQPSLLFPKPSKCIYALTPKAKRDLAFANPNGEREETDRSDEDKGLKVVSSIQELLEILKGETAKMHAHDVLDSVKMTFDPDPLEILGSAKEIVEVVETKRLLFGEIDVHTKGPDRFWQLKDLLRTRIELTMGTFGTCIWQMMVTAWLRRHLVRSMVTYNMLSDGYCKEREMALCGGPGFSEGLGGVDCFDHFFAIVVFSLANRPNVLQFEFINVLIIIELSMVLTPMRIEVGRRVAYVIDDKFDTVNRVGEVMNSDGRETDVTLGFGKLGIVQKEEYHAVVVRVLVKCLELIRKLQLVYCLKLAGSQSGQGLEDYLSLLFLFGSLQLIDHNYMNFLDEYLHLSRIAFSKQVKELLAEHLKYILSNVGFPRWRSTELRDQDVHITDLVLDDTFFVDTEPSDAIKNAKVINKTITLYIVDCAVCGLVAGVIATTYGVAGFAGQLQLTLIGGAEQTFACSLKTRMNIRWVERADDYVEKEIVEELVVISQEMGLLETHLFFIENGLRVKITLGAVAYRTGSAAINRCVMGRICHSYNCPCLKLCA